MVLRQRVEDGIADVPGHHRRETGRASERTRERGDRGLAVRTGDCDYFGVRRQRAGEELDVADELGAARNRRRDERLILRNAGADRNQVGAGDSGLAEGPGRQPHAGERRMQPISKRGRGPRVGDADRGAAGGQMACERVAGEPEPQDDHVAMGVVHQRSLSVESPNSTSSMVMIQNRTTTWFSFQPFNS